jgi:aryl-alcohol dehydrogenase-like predicted oxidoreductase
MALPTEVLGGTGLQITRVGFGAWAIGGNGWRYAWGGQDDEKSVAAIHRAIELGINWIDTAACYGRGHSEEVVARALRGIPENDHPYIFTKCGVIAPEGDAEPSLVGDPASIRREVEDSLRRLRVEVIDLYQVHWPAQDGTPLEAYWQTMLDLKAEGKVRHVGLSNHDRGQLEQAEAVGPVETLQPPFSAISRDTATDLLPWAVSRAAGVIVYSPMASGLLTGAFTAERVADLPADDWRATHPDFTGDALARNVRLARLLEEIGQQHGVSPGAVAIAWTLGWPGVTGAIAGARSPEQVDGWIAGADLDLSAEDYRALAGLIEQASIGSGPTLPFEAASC